MMAYLNLDFTPFLLLKDCALDSLYSEQMLNLSLIMQFLLYPQVQKCISRYNSPFCNIMDFNAFILL